MFDVLRNQNHTPHKMMFLSVLKLSIVLYMKSTGYLKSLTEAPLVSFLMGAQCLEGGFRIAILRFVIQIDSL